MAKKNVTSPNTDGTEVDQTTVAPAAPKVEIVRGRMPVAVVAMIRFKEIGVGTSALAAKYRTTIGKIDDILKGRNFGYISENFQPSEAQVADAKVYLGNLSEANQADTLAKLDAMGVNEDGGAGFDEARKAARKTKAKPAASAAPAAPAAEGSDTVGETDMSEFTE
jgi:hypothetical protein